MRARLCDLATERSFRSRKRSWESGGEGSSRCDCGRRSGPCLRRAEAVGRSIPSMWPMKVRTLLGRPPPCNAAAYLGHVLPAQLPQPEEAGAVPFGRNLQEPGNVAESLVIDELAEGNRTDLALADVLVTVDAGSERFHRIVEVEGVDGSDPQHLVECFEGRRQALLRGDVVAGGEYVAGVQAHRDPLRAPAEVANRTQLFEASSQTRPLAGGGFEQDLASAFVGGEDAVQGLRDVAQALLAIGIRARMQDQGRKPEQIRAGKLVGECSDGLLAQVAGPRTEVHEVAGVDGARQRRFL